MTACRWWEAGPAGWELKGTGLYVPEGPPTEGHSEGGIIMRTAGDTLDAALRSRDERPRRGGQDNETHYILINGGTEEMRRRGLLEGVRAMANRIYAGQNWWLDSSRSSIECLYRRGAQASPTRYIIAIAREGTTADRHTGEETQDQGADAEEATDESGAGSSGSQGKRSRGDDRTKGGRGTRQKTGDG